MERKQLAIWGPGRRHINVLAGCQSLQPATAVGKLPVEVQSPFLIRVKRYPLTVWRPNWATVNAPFERESTQCFPREIVEPNLPIRGNCNALTVRGKPRGLVGVRGGCQRLLGSFTINPHQSAL